jgi:hypothetical protein
MPNESVSLRQLIHSSVSLVQRTFDLPDNAGGLERLKRTRELSDAIEHEWRIVKLLCFVDAAKTVFCNASWLNAFNSAVAWTINDLLAKQFCDGNVYASWDLFLKRLDAFNRSSAKLAIAYSSWELEYSKVVAQRIDGLGGDHNDNEDELPTWMLIGIYYANARIHMTDGFCEFLLAQVVEIDEEDQRMLAERKSTEFREHP